MLTGPTSRAEQLIYQRRAQEQKVSNMQTKLKQEFHQQEFAKWQNKGKNIEVNNQVKQRLASLRQAAASNLQSRRYSPPHLGKNWHRCCSKKIAPTRRKSWPCRKLHSRLASAWQNV